VRASEEAGDQMAKRGAAGLFLSDDRLVNEGPPFFAVPQVALAFENAKRG